MKKRNLLEIMRVLITAVAFLLLVATMQRNGVSAGDILKLLKAVNLPFVIAGFLLYLGVAFLLALRLRLMFSAHAINLSYWHVVALTLVGFFFNNVLPSAIGGDAAKMFYASRHTCRGPEAVTSVFADRMIGMCSMVLIAGFAVIFAGRLIEYKEIIWTITILVAAAVFLLVLAANRKLASKFRFLLKLLKVIKLDVLTRRIYELIHSYREHRVLVLKAFVYSFGLQIMSIIVNVLLAKGLFLSVPVIFFFLFVPIIGAMSLIPSLGGLGVREGGYVLFFGKFVSAGDAFALSLLFLLTLLGLSVLGGIVYLFDPRFKIRIKSGA